MKVAHVRPTWESDNVDRSPNTVLPVDRFVHPNHAAELTELELCPHTTVRVYDLDLEIVDKSSGVSSAPALDVSEFTVPELRAIMVCCVPRSPWSLELHDWDVEFRLNGELYNLTWRMTKAHDAWPDGIVENQFGWRLLQLFPF